MRTIVAGLLLAATVLITGCATPPQPPLALRGEALAKPGARVGVVMTVLPKPDTYFPGADCLLCLAAAATISSDLTAQVRTLGTDELAALPKDLATLLTARGQTVVVLDKPIELDKLPEGSREPNQARRDFTALAAPHQLDKLLVVQVQSLGFTRNFAAYVPTGEPRATLIGAAYLVDLRSKALDWYHPLNLSTPAAVKWDEPPKYPGLTNAYFQTLEAAMDQVKKPFARP